jgi:hypothetical protein
MIVIPKSEKERFTEIVKAQAQRFNLEPTDYLQKIWYHEEAAKLGEYVAMTLMSELLSLIIKADEITSASAS